MLKKKSGFTLIELLVVIGILGILLAIVLIAINPARQFAQANNTARRSDVTTLLNAIHQYAADNKGKLPLHMPVSTDSSVQIMSGAAASVGDICSSISPTYVASLPTDPTLNIPAISDCTSYATGYFVAVDAAGRVTVSAPGAEKIGDTTPDIAVTR